MWVLYTYRQVGGHLVNTIHPHFCLLSSLQLESDNLCNYPFFPTVYCLYTVLPKPWGTASKFMKSAKRHIKKGTGSQGKLLITRPFGKSYQESTFTCDSVGCYPGPTSLEKLVSIQGPCGPLGHTKGMLRQQYYGVV